MTERRIRAEVVLERIAWVRKMVDSLRALPSSTLNEFEADARTAAAAESFLRRALESLLDLGRHLLAKGYGEGVVEYKEIALRLVQVGILPPETRDLLLALAGYRNRLTHYYDEVSSAELFDIVKNRLQDIELILDAILVWLRVHPERLDQSL